MGPILPSLGCPRCDTVLIGPGTRGAHGYRCDGCGGRAITLAGLRPRHPPAVLRAVWQARSPDHGLVCPSCRSGMLVVQPELGGVSIELDVCRRCQLVWFDAGELERLPAVELPAPRVRPSWPSDAAAGSALSARLPDLTAPGAAPDSGEVGWLALELAIDVALELLD